MIVYFVTGGSDDQSDSLTKMGVEHRLISYWYLKGKKKNFIPDYVERGTGRDPRKGDVPVQRRFRQKFRGGHKPGAYNCERMNQDPDKPEFRRSLYEKADSLESVRMFEMAGLKPEDQLQQLKSEIEFRVKITKNEIFKIGECLMHVKRICQQEKISFQQWISEHLDFSYETANNEVGRQ